MQYHKYLKSKFWFKKKKKLIKGWKCRICGSRENLNVHHKTYKNIFHEKKSDLMVLCKNCHEYWHLMKEPTKTKVKKALEVEKYLKNR